MVIIGIDPGTTKSGIATVDFHVGCSTGACYRATLIASADMENHEILKELHKIRLDFFNSAVIAIEHIISRKWSGRETSDAAIWSGVFAGQIFSQTRFVTRARVRWEILQQKTGGDKEINKALKTPDDRFPGLSDSILALKPGSHQMAAVAVAVAAFLNPECSKLGGI
jgi:hypothetical protein